MSKRTSGRSPTSKPPKKQSPASRRTAKVGEWIPPYRVSPDEAQQIAEAIRTLVAALDTYEHRWRESQLSGRKGTDVMPYNVLDAVVRLIRLLDAATKPGQRDIRVARIRGLIDGMLARLKWERLDVHAPPAAPTGGELRPAVLNEIDMTWMAAIRAKKYNPPSLAEYIEPLRQYADELAAPAPPMILRRKHVAILKKLNEQSGVAMIQTDIASAVDLSEKTVSTAIQELREAGLTSQYGERGGEVITDTGRKRINSG